MGAGSKSGGRGGPFAPFVGGCVPLHGPASPEKPETGQLGSGRGEHKGPDAGDLSRVSY